MLAATLSAGGHAMDEPGTWLTINEAAKRTGWLPDKIRSDRRRGRLQSRKNNAGEWLVLVPSEAQTMLGDPSSHANGHADSHAIGQADSQAMATPPAWLLEELAELRERIGHAEGRAAGMAAQMASMAAGMALERAGMAETVAAERARGDRLEAALAEARKGWLERLLEAVRRRP
jgi:hypothetical protein